MKEGAASMGDTCQTAVVLHHVSKFYRLYSSEKQRAKALLVQDVAYQEKRAVNDISFEICKGESVAILGQNGAGKSTILKMIAGVTFPNEGIVRIKGRVSALLELSAGFNPQLTGRDNIYFRSEVLGISKKEIKEMEEGIISFAEVGDYIDQPVKKYSSGMRARLGFAINVAIHPDVVIVDEALSVGDRRFREKCNVRIKEIIDDGATFIFVTHSAYEAKKFCRRGMVIRNGILVFDGPIEQATAFYEETLKN